MKTPITDLNATVIKTGLREGDEVVDAEVSRRLEIARSGVLEALKFYADVSKYPAPKTGGLGDLYFDCGSIARAAIAKATGKEPAQ